MPRILLVHPSSYLILFALIVCFADPAWARVPQDLGSRAGNLAGGNFILCQRVSKAVSPYPCLQKGIKLNDVVTYDQGAKKITVKDKLKEIKARCRRGILVDGKGRPIYFYALKGCWGNPPANYQEILERQKKEIRKLKNRYTVIEMTCNPGGLPIQ